jgi:hypothetical protein
MVPVQINFIYNKSMQNNLTEDTKKGARRTWEKLTLIKNTPLSLVYPGQPNLVVSQVDFHAQRTNILLIVDI